MKDHTTTSSDTPIPVDNTTTFTNAVGADCDANHSIDLARKLASAQEEGLEPNLRRWLRFAGVAEGEFFELQALKVEEGNWKNNYYAFVNSVEEAAYLENDLRSPPVGYYIVANKHDAAVFSRASSGEWHRAIEGECTGNNDITHRRVLFIDVDAARVKNTSATEEEMARAHEVGVAIYQWLAGELGERACGFGHSGNGRSGMVALSEVPQDAGTTAIVSELLAAISVKFAAAGAHVDLSVSDAKRLVPMFGTMKRKGAQGNADRPHRRTAFVCSNDVDRVGLDALQYLLENLRSGMSPEELEQVTEASEAMKKNATGVAKTTRNGTARGRNSSRYDQANAVPVQEVLKWKGLVRGGREHCPGCDEVGSVVSNGFKCFHDRCATKGNKGFRTPVDIVCEADGVTHDVAVASLEAQFGLEPIVAGGSRGRKPSGRSAWATMDDAMKVFLDEPKWKSVLAFDMRRDGVYFVREPPWDDDYAGANRSLPRAVEEEDLTRVRTWFERTQGLSLGKDLANDALACAAKQNPVDEVRDYFEHLEWDRTFRLDTWLTVYLGAEDTPFAREVGAAWLVSAAARTFDPGCKVDHVLVLEGPQGAGKSSAFEVLAGRNFTDGLHDLKSKDAAMELRGMLIVELSELEALKRSDIATIKAFLTRRCDRYRAPYERRVGEHPRRCIFGGSVNDATYLVDGTGNRRFWPVKCGTIDIAALERDRDQLWGEAVERFRCGEQWWLSPGVEGAAFEAQEGRRAADPWEQPVEEYLTRHPDEVRVSDLLKDALGIKAGDQNRTDQMRCAGILQRLDWEKQQIRAGAYRGQWVYKPRAREDDASREDSAPPLHTATDDVAPDDVDEMSNRASVPWRSNSWGRGASSTVN